MKTSPIDNVPNTSTSTTVPQTPEGIPRHHRTTGNQVLDALAARAKEVEQLRQDVAEKDEQLRAEVAERQRLWERLQKAQEQIAAKDRELEAMRRHCQELAFNLDRIRFVVVAFVFFFACTLPSLLADVGFLKQQGESHRETASEEHRRNKAKASNRLVPLPLVHSGLHSGFRSHLVFFSVADGATSQTSIAML